MVSALVVVGMESYLTTRGAGHSHSHEIWEDSDEEEDHGHGDGLHSARGGSMAARRGPNRPMNIALEDLGASEGLMAACRPCPRRLRRCN